MRRGGSDTDECMTRRTSSFLSRVRFNIRITYLCHVCVKMSCVCTHPSAPYASACNPTTTEANSCAQSSTSHSCWSCSFSSRLCVAASTPQHSPCRHSFATLRLEGRQARIALDVHLAALRVLTCGVFHLVMGGWLMVIPKLQELRFVWSLFRSQTTKLPPVRKAEIMNMPQARLVLRYRGMIITHGLHLARNLKA